MGRRQRKFNLRDLTNQEIQEMFDSCVSDEYSNTSDDDNQNDLVHFYESVPVETIQLEDVPVVENLR